MPWHSNFQSPSKVERVAFYFKVGRSIREWHLNRGWHCIFQSPSNWHSIKRQHSNKGNTKSPNEIP
ncbi:unnamed protein product [Meloidogyne enterolobii]|uniref:Uncharacterized protein n=1 Tax=Meloidogyne enterolobii TaxID=390850 RepID=A0ACB0Z6L4_MELEN